MNKESIYRIIGYHGEYSESVKKTLKKILKDNHPDRGGDAEIFKLINEVKDELENNRVSFKYVSAKNNDSNGYCQIDFEYCEKMIKNICKELLTIDEKISEYKEKIKELNNRYQDVYQNDLKERHYFLNDNISKELTKIKNISLFLLIIIVITFIIAIIKNNIIVFGIFGLMSLILVFVVTKYFNITRNIAMNNENNLKKYIKTANKLSMIKEEKDKIIINKWKEEQKKKKKENDLRFYNNLIKYK